MESKEYPYKEIEVTISVTLSKTVNIMVSDYDVDEEGVPDFSDCDIQRAVESQVVLPQNLAEFTEKMFNHDLNLKASGMPKYLKEAVEDCKDWCVDEMEVILE